MQKFHYNYLPMCKHNINKYYKQQIKLFNISNSLIQKNVTFLNHFFSSIYDLSIVYLMSLSVE